MNIQPRPSARSPAILVIWVLVTISIPLLSIHGRSLQRFVKASLSSTSLAVIFVTFSLVLFLFLINWSRSRKNTIGYWPLVWLVPLFLLFPMTLPQVEERLHFIVFGLFGFFSMRIFPPIQALSIGLAVSGLDEVLQWALPDRVGDWRDVAFNATACLGGASAAFWGRKQ